MSFGLKRSFGRIIKSHEDQFKNPNEKETNNHIVGYDEENNISYVINKKCISMIQTSKETK
jgi:hypothetical protein